MTSAHHLVVESGLLRNVRRVVGVDNLPSAELVDLRMRKHKLFGMGRVTGIVVDNTFTELVGLRRGKKKNRYWAWAGYEYACRR